MAITPIATVTTLGQTIDEIRERTGTISEEESELYFLPLANLIHDAIVLVKDKQDPAAMRTFYTTEPVTVTETSNLVDLSVLDIASMMVDDISYYDSANGSATLFGILAFQNFKTIYSTAQMANMFLAYVGNIGQKMQLRTYRGSALMPAGTLTFGYIRNPKKTVVATEKLDCTEAMIRQAIEVVVQWVPQRLKVSQ